MDLKAAAGIVTALGPTKDHREQFGRTFIGTLLGQATVLLLMFTVYIIALVLLGKFALSDLQTIQTTVGNLWFWILSIVPFICIVLFSLVPTLWQVTRERRLKERLIVGEDSFNADYFRLYPYSALDYEMFHRLDGAGVKILNWIKSSQASLLYLSGASGVGKSSLLAADVLPKLKTEGWSIVNFRIFDNPVARMRTALLEQPEFFSRRPNTESSPRSLLERISEGRKRKGESPILLVIDQFEEFLILNDEKARVPFTDILHDIANTPIDGVQILLVFRSDYHPLIFKLELPSLTAGNNWQELAPYGRGEATLFIQGGGRRLSPEVLDDLFHGLDRIDGTPGLYRPITLNMVGLVLERMGRMLEGDPAQLVQRYLSDCLIAGESRDFAKAILANMISDAGTKEPRRERDLVALTHFQPWQVKASLAELGERGLVRLLESTGATWEVSHDFVARIIGQLIGRTKPPFTVRVRPFIAPIVLGSWILFSSAALLVAFFNEKPARLIVNSVRPLSVDDDGGRNHGKLPVNIGYTNVGGRANIGGTIKAKPITIIADSELTKQEEDRNFEKLIKTFPDKLEFNEETETQPGQNLFFTLLLENGKGLQDAIDQDKIVYVMFAIYYWDKSLRNGRYHVTEGCFQLRRDSAPGFCRSRIYTH
jgi:hypothetical protein